MDITRVYTVRPPVVPATRDSQKQDLTERIDGHLSTQSAAATLIQRRQPLDQRCGGALFTEHPSSNLERRVGLVMTATRSNWRSLTLAPVIMRRLTHHSWRSRQYKKNAHHVRTRTHLLYKEPYIVIFRKLYMITCILKRRQLL